MGYGYVDDTVDIEEIFYGVYEDEDEFNEDY